MKWLVIQRSYQPTKTADLANITNLLGTTRHITLSVSSSITDSDGNSLSWDDLVSEIFAHDETVLV